MPVPDQNKLDRLKTALYSRDGYVPDDPITPLSKQTSAAPTDWEQRHNIPELPVRKHTPFVKIIIWFAVIFFVAAVCIAGWLFYTGYNTVSTGNVTVTVAGPTSIAGGEPLSLNVTIENHNTVDLQNVYLSVAYPDGARKGIDTVEPLLRDRISIGSLASGAATSKTIQAVFFGVAGTAEKMPISVQYNVVDSVAPYDKQTEYNFTLEQPPVSVEIQAPTEVSSGQTVNLGVDVISNTTVPLSNIAIRMEYPTGFTFSAALPVPDADNNVWNIATLAPGQKQHFTIIGTLEGPENESRSFNYSVGNPDPTNRRSIATVFVTDAKQVTLTKPFIGLNLAMGGDSSATHFIANGGTVSNNLTLTNNVGDQLSDVTVQIKLNGPYLDKSSIQAGQGFYQTATNILSWDKRQVSTLGTIDSGDHSNVSFTFGTIPFSQLRTAAINQPVTISITATANRLSADGPQQVTSTITRQVKFLSQASLVGATVHGSGPFSNTGPLPPRAEKETSYTIVWNIYNTYNALTKGQVKATLPPYVKFLDVISPSDQNLTYNPSSGEIIWNVGDIPANTGYGNAPRQVNFQVSLTPSKTQINTAPQLIGAATLTAQDTVTNQGISSLEVPLTTQMPTDPSYKAGQGVVGQ